MTHDVTKVSAIYHNNNVMNMYFQCYVMNMYFQCSGSILTNSMCILVNCVIRDPSLTAQMYTSTPFQQLSEEFIFYMNGDIKLKSGN